MGDDVTGYEDRYCREFCEQGDDSAIFAGDFAYCSLQPDPFLHAQLT